MICRHPTHHQCRAENVLTPACGRAQVEVLRGSDVASSGRRYCLKWVIDQGALATLTFWLFVCTQRASGACAPPAQLALCRHRGRCDADDIACGARPALGARRAFFRRPAPAPPPRSRRKVARGYVRQVPLAVSVRPQPSCLDFWGRDGKSRASSEIACGCDVSGQVRRRLRAEDKLH